MEPPKASKKAPPPGPPPSAPPEPVTATPEPVTVTGIPVATNNINNAPVNNNAPVSSNNNVATSSRIKITTSNARPNQLHVHGWTTGLFDCDQDVENCCITLWCPCITFGQIAEIVDKGSTPCAAGAAMYTLIAALTGFQCIYSCFYRYKLRAQYGLPESPLPDCIVHFCCEACALCQNYRELKNRGFDMNIGWHANMQRQGHVVLQPPTVQAGMVR